MRPARILEALALALLPALAPAPSRACGGPDYCVTDRGTYLAELPAGPARGAVLLLHGWGGSAAAEMRNRAVVDVLLARGWAAIAPVGLQVRPGVPTAGWNAAADPGARDDVAFLVGVADDAARRFGLPRAEMVLAGFSLGGMMVWRAVCDAPGAFRAYAPVAGTFWRPMPRTCAGPAALLHVHGWTDRVVPLEGRPIPSARIEQGDVFAALDLLRAAGGCPMDAPDGHAARGIYLVRSWTACAPGTAIGLALHPGGHVVPEGWADLLLDWLAGTVPPKA